jgi:serine protease AprX
MQRIRRPRGGLLPRGESGPGRPRGRPLLIVLASLVVGLCFAAPALAVDPYATYPGSLASVTRIIGAQDAWLRGYTGAGIGVALIDTGVAPVPGLEGQVVKGPDLSFEGQAPNLAFIDSFGHGTHLAGIIAGRDPDLPVTGQGADDGFLGVAPKAKVVSIKVGSSDGSVDVTQVLAAIDWAVQHRNDAGLNIRVICLAFGTDSTQPYTSDPLAYAVDKAWRKGVIVVASAGNTGARGILNDPATNPRIIAVGADDTAGTTATSDDIIPSWSTVGSAQRSPDLVAPGRSILGLRDPGAAVDELNPEARVGNRYLRGSGTSQAAAVVAGAAALIVQRWRDIKPDQVKYLLESTARPIPGADPLAAGAGLLDVGAALSVKDKPGGCDQHVPDAQGRGSLEGARGSFHVTDEGTELRGEVDLFGQAWNTAWWVGHCCNDTWKADHGSLTWNQRSWSIAPLGADSGDAVGDWADGAWNGRSWSGRSWSGRSWSGRSWSGRSWSGRSWSGDSWSGYGWSAGSWSNNAWSTRGWGL